jgi:hypothetical protein
MDPHLKPSKALTIRQESQVRNSEVDNWDRWDEELVEDFSRWLGRLGKALVILLIGIFAVSAI